MPAPDTANSDLEVSMSNVQGCLAEQAFRFGLKVHPQTRWGSGDHGVAIYEDGSVVSVFRGQPTIVHCGISILVPLETTDWNE